MYVRAVDSLEKVLRNTGKSFETELLIGLKLTIEARLAGQ